MTDPKLPSKAECEAVLKRLPVWTYDEVAALIEAYMAAMQRAFLVSPRWAGGIDHLNPGCRTRRHRGAEVI